MQGGPENPTGSGGVRWRDPFLWSTMVLLLVALAGGVWIARLQGAQAQQAVGSVGGKPITQSDLLQALAEQPGGRQQLAAAVDQIISERLVDQEAQRKGIRITDQEVERQLAQTRQRFASDQAYRQALAQAGITETVLRRNIRINLELEKLLGGDVRITDQQMRDYFAQNHDQFDTPAQVKARHILLPSQQEADQVRRQLAAGGDWGALAKRYSLDAATRDKGGELGYVSPGTLDPAAESALSALKQGEISQPVQTQAGWEILQAEAIKPPVPAKYEQVKDRIHQILLDQAVQQRLPGWLADLKQKAKATNSYSGAS
ncbi:MAG: peptidyl-prolyl cis-trans isomerase [Bacillota bacterium]|nr:peptidyl-prolyl cis-trans isomerase [Bacillota bacterium]